MMTGGCSVSSPSDLSIKFSVNLSNTQNSRICMSLCSTVFAPKRVNLIIVIFQNQNVTDGLIPFQNKPSAFSVSCSRIALPRVACPPGLSPMPRGSSFISSRLKSHALKTRVPCPWDSSSMPSMLESHALEARFPCPLGLSPMLSSFESHALKARVSCPQVSRPMSSRRRFQALKVRVPCLPGSSSMPSGSSSPMPSSFMPSKINPVSSSENIYKATCF